MAAISRSAGLYSSIHVDFLNKSSKLCVWTLEIESAALSNYLWEENKNTSSGSKTDAKIDVKNTISRSAGLDSSIHFQTSSVCNVNVTKHSLATRLPLACHLLDIFLPLVYHFLAACLILTCGHALHFQPFGKPEEMTYRWYDFIVSTFWTQAQACVFRSLKIESARLPNYLLKETKNTRSKWKSWYLLATGCHQLVICSPLACHSLATCAQLASH